MAEGTGKARVQVELTPNLSVGTEVNDQSQTGVGLQWSTTTDHGRPDHAAAHRSPTPRRRRASTLPADGSTFGTPFDLNLIGLWTLYQKEVWRFWKVATQTVLAPVVTTLVFLAIFALAMHRADTRIGGLPFLRFLAPGLIMMAIVQNAFANTSSSLVIAKIQGNIVDYLMPPLGPGELLFGIVMGGITRGVVVGLAVWLCHAAVRATCRRCTRC